MNANNLDRRKFLGTSALLAAAISNRAYAAQTPQRRRVGLIGAGWYGKCDLLQLINVEPVEVVSICDVDSQMLAEAAALNRVASAIEETAAHLLRLP